MLNWLRQFFQPTFNPTRDADPDLHLSLCHLIWSQVLHHFPFDSSITSSDGFTTLNENCAKLYGPNFESLPSGDDSLRKVKLNAMMLSGAANSNGENGVSFLFQIPLAIARSLDGEYDASHCLEEVWTFAHDGLRLLKMDPEWQATIECCKLYASTNG
ncbi:MAG: hypothetical protein Rhob2KO_54630 [Rhodopirellula baltica]